jgi:hypothetical protein
MFTRDRVQPVAFRRRRVRPKAKTRGNGRDILPSVYIYAIYPNLRLTGWKEGTAKLKCTPGLRHRVKGVVAVH